MRFSWGKDDIGLAKKVLMAKKRHWFWDLIDKYLPPFILITCIIVTIWIWVKIFQLWVIHRYLMSF